MPTPAPLSTDFTTALTQGTTVNDPHPKIHKDDRDRMNFLLNMIGNSQKYRVVNNGGATTNTSSIQVALDEVAAAGGGIVYVTGGGFYRTSSAGTSASVSGLNVSSNTHLIVSRDTTIQRGATGGGLLVNKGDRTIGGYGQTRNIRVTGGIWDCNLVEFPTQSSQPMTFVHAEDIVVEDATIINSRGSHHMEFNACKGVKVSNCRLGNMPNTPAKELIQFDIMGTSNNFPDFGPYDGTGCQDVEVIGCKFYNAACGIGTHGDRVGTNPRNFRIVNNHFENMTEDAVMSVGYSDIVISNNTFNDCAGMVFINAETQILNNVVVTNNTWSNPKAGAPRVIWVRGAEEGIAAATATTQKFTRRIVIDGNTINGCAGIGLEVSYAKDAVVSNNIVTGCDSIGINIYRSDGCIVAGNIARGNVLNTTAAGVADIAVGHATATPEATVDTIVNGNQAGSIRINLATNLIAANNITGTYTKAAGSTNIREANNIVGGALQAGAIA